ncbi:hypothetical protein J3R30DRAFT_3678573 [Lentinula aciculospora]|uniref:Uncharacterized protein n=1 Tax=Lentinula aciculospora TaxID=153920 RepID=A0A9W9AUX8_9AGAR|nr:hypothetical protein J3R30DRAFT_3678573 [Lentinula aciculospora]
MSASLPPICQITENPDIAGIGVRLSIYIPAILVTLNSGYIAAKVCIDAFTGKLSVYFNSVTLRSLSDDGDSVSASDLELTDLEAASQSSQAPSPTRSSRSSASSTSSSSSWYTDDGEEYLERVARGYLNYLSDHPHYFESSKSLERSLFLIGSAMIVSAFLDARFSSSSIGLPPYHALIVLNLSFLNNLAGSILLPLRFLAVCAEIWYGEEEDVILPKSLWYLAMAIDVSGLAVIQTLVIIAFGIWFWVSTTFFHSFSGYSMTVDKLVSSASYNSTLAASSVGSSEPSQCLSKTFYWAFRKVPVESTLSLQIISLIFYIGTAAFPVLGPFVYVTPTIVIIRSVPLVMAMAFSGIIYLFGIVLPRITTRLIYTFLPKIYHLSITIPYPHKRLFPRILSPTAISTKLIFLTIVVTNLSTVLYLIISTEETISINSVSRSGSVVISGSQWTYGQTLALLTAVIGVFMYVAELVGQWKEVLLERRKRLLEQGNNDNIITDVTVDAEDANGKDGKASDSDKSGSHRSNLGDGNLLFSWTKTSRRRTYRKRANSI